MHEPYTKELISARFTFFPGRAGEFLEGEGRLITQIECETLDEVMEYTHQFDDALENVIAVINGRVVCLSGEVYSADDHKDIEDEEV